MPKVPETLEHLAGYGRGFRGRLHAQLGYRQARESGLYASSTTYEQYLTHRAIQRMPPKGSMSLSGESQRQIERARREFRKRHGSTLLAGGELGVATTRRQILGG